MTIHYICAYAEPEWLNDYRITPSGSAKINYIKSALHEAGSDVSIFSPICFKSDNLRVKGRRKVVVSDSEVHHYPMSIGGNNKIVRLLSYALIYLQLFFYLLFHVRRNDKVLLYHAIKGTNIIAGFAKIMNLDFYLELEEIYSAVFHQSDGIEKEKKLVSSIANGYILVNNIIKDKCHIRKPAVVCEGQYQVLSNAPKKVVGENGKINVLYAGVIEEGADAFTAISTAKLLSSNYHLHVAGYGSDEAVAKLVQEIDSYNRHGFQCSITFHGCLHGAEYEALLAKCSVGLCSRVLEDELSDYTFPSKVFAYLARNLKVVCTPISCVVASPLAGSIVFAKSISAQALADAIMSISKDLVIDNSNLLQKEHQRFVCQLKELF